jgi:hypothetical protein
MLKINDVLSQKERKKLLNLCRPLVKDTPGYPAKQSDEFLHLNPRVRKYINIFNQKISNRLSKQIYFQKVWVNEDRGYKRDVYWHNHSFDLAAVYYLKTIPLINSGTLFQDKFVRCKQNSILIFPGHLIHGTPSYPFHWIKRYSIAMDINIHR